MVESRKLDLVSVIVITWNSEKFIEECLSSVFKQSYPQIEVIVTDNGSGDSTTQIIRSRFQSVILIENKQNLGYCKANNIALKSAKGTYLLFLNSDVILENDYIEKCIDGFKTDSKIGMITGKILRFDRITIDSTGQFLTRSRKTKERGYGSRDDGRFDIEGRVFSVCGASAFYRRRMIEDISYADGELFDEDFFSFHEDIDVGWRGNLHGWNGYYIPDAIAYHYRGGTAGSLFWRRYFQIAARPSEIKYHIVKNRYLSILKNDSLGSYLRDLPFILSRDLIVFTYLLFSSPGVLALLFKNRKLFRKAMEKRSSMVKGRLAA
ncbi:MAG: glycosyltransferase family 2 protein [Acidobacteriota bacterium]